MGEVLSLRSGGDAIESTAEATAKIVAWLREQANELESGEARPVHKAVLTVFEDCGDQIRVNSTFCNARFVERVGIMYTALNDVANSDGE